MSKKLLLVVTILVVAAVSIASFAYTQTSETVSLTINGGGGSSFVHTSTVADGAVGPDGGPHTNQNPAWSPIEGTAGSISQQGELYYIVPAGGYSGDMWVTLYLLNPDELAQCYSYLNVGVKTYEISGTTWISSTMGTAIDEWLTLSNGLVSINLTGNITYALSIDDISWYCTDGTCDQDGESLSPAFFADVLQK